MHAIDIILEKLSKSKFRSSFKLKEKDFVYIDSSNVSENFYNDLNNNFLSEKLKSQNIDLKTIPNILIVKEGKIVKVLYKKQPSKLKVKQAEDFIKKNWIDE